MTEKPKLRLFDLTMIVIGLVIGMGIFRTSRDAAQAALTPSIYFAAWVIGGVVALCGALTYAEIGSRYPVTGGYYKVFSYAYHPSIAFALNCSILISNAASISGVALIGSGYITHVFFPGSSEFITQIIAMLAILVFYGVNLIGLKMSSRTQNVLMMIKILMLVMLIVALFFPGTSAKDNVPLSQPVDAGWSSILTSFGLCLIAVSFTYGGYQQTINFGNEVDRPSKNIPKGIFIGIALIILLYLLVNISYYNVVGFNELKVKHTAGQAEVPVASIVIDKMFGKQGADAFSVLLFLSVLAYVNVSLLSNPRVMYAMSEDGVLPKVFQRKSVSKGVYMVSLTVFAVIAMIVVFFAETFDKILSFSIFLDSFGMVTSAAAIFMLRKRTKHLDGTGIYKMRFFPLLPIVFILAYVFVCASITINTPKIALTGTAVLAVSLLLYFLITKSKRNNVPAE
ncbi:MAG: APC family permease [Flavisolibacter sp.]|nr:APC family permease [Flavisolibacter sp.]